MQEFSFLSKVIIAVVAVVLITTTLLYQRPRHWINLAIFRKGGNVALLLYVVLLLGMRYLAETCSGEFCALGPWLTAQFPVGFLYLYLVQLWWEVDWLFAWYDYLPEYLAEPILFYGFIPINALVYWYVGNSIQRLWHRFVCWRSNKSSRVQH